MVNQEQQREATENIISQIAGERVRQFTELGFDAKHDDQYRDGELGKAASFFALQGTGMKQVVKLPDRGGDTHWTWEEGKETDVSLWSRRKCLVVAAALIVAEIERLERLGVEAEMDA